MSILDSKQYRHVEDFSQFITASPSSFHAVNEVASRLRARGYKQMLEHEPISTSVGGHFFIRDGALIAWFIPAQASAFRIVGTHSDSPALKVKPSGSSFTQDGWNQIDVELYGGLLLNSWLDREIGFAGRVIDHFGREHLVETGAIARVPQLAIHLDRDANSGLELNRQNHLQPIWTYGQANFFDYVAELLGLESKDDIAGHDLYSYTTESPAFFGLDKEFFASGRQDNLSSVHAGVTALERMEDTQFADVAVLAVFDHEEIGSSTRSGAAGPILETTLRRIALGLGKDEDGYHQMLARSTCVSADAAHFVHPNYAEKHDPKNHPVPGKGPILKLNANQRYASDAVGAALWHRMCEAAQVDTQEFVSNNTVPSGSTIGPITATRLGITTVDVGIGLLSMHSAREMSYVPDHLALSRALEEYWKGA